MGLIGGIAGIIGTILIVGGWILGILGYNSKPDKPFDRRYNPLTHLVSTLGHANTPRSTLVNISVVLGAIALGLVMLAVGLRVPDDAIKAVIIVGAILAGVAGALVGIFPSGKPTEGSPHHLIFAFGFFLLSATVVAVFTSFLLFGGREVVLVGLVIPGVLVVLAAAVMLVAGLVKLIPGDTDWSVPDLANNIPTPTSVPRAMFLPTAEWAYVILLNIWVLAVSIFLLTSL